MRRFCMSGVSRQSGTLCDFRPGDGLSIAERCVGCREQLITLVIEGNGVDASERLIVEIGQACVDLEIFKGAID